MSDDEVIAMGMSPIVNDGQLSSPLDNPVVEELLAGGGLPQTDRAGRPVISFSQYLRLRKQGNLSNYSLWVERPGSKGAWTIQASKYRKYLSAGYEAVGAPDNHRHTVQELIQIGMDARQAVAVVEGRKSKKAAPVLVRNDEGDFEDTKVYWCREKYPDCKRFYDNPTGLKAHWGKDHGEWAFAKKPARKAKEE